MAWLWDTFADFKDAVDPIEADNPGFLNMARHDSTAHNWHSMMEEQHEFSEAVEVLKPLTKLNPRMALGDEDAREIVKAIFAAVRHGERVLGYDRRLASSESGSDFIADKSFAREADRYFNEGRLLYELEDFYKACVALRKEIWDQMQRDERFLRDVVKLPKELELDFITARNLFSVGFDEIGVLMTGRGFEGVMREIARRKGVEILDGKTGKRQAAEADLREITEVFYRLRWRGGGERVIDQAAKTLLDYVRALRNSLAHPSTARRSGSWREQAVVIAEKASHVWEQAITAKRALKSKSVVKDWN